MTNTNTVQLASIRVITEDLPGLVRFYEVVTGATAQYLTDDFVELVPPSATFALSHPRRVAFISEGMRCEISVKGQFSTARIWQRLPPNPPAPIRTARPTR